jgi:hypothetical protein
MSPIRNEPILPAECRATRGTYGSFGPREVHRAFNDELTTEHLAHHPISPQSWQVKNKLSKHLTKPTQRHTDTTTATSKA